MDQGQHGHGHQGRSGDVTTGTTDEVVHHLVLDLLDQRSADTVPMPADLVYDAADPYAVALVFSTPQGPIRWDFARELLADGLFDVVGDGDVHLWPCLDTSARAVVMIELVGSDGSLVELQASSRSVAAFLAETDAVVPPGSEASRVDLDAMVEELLTRA
ncbi:MAG: sporulation protein SsgA [Marmoricola sp.]|nr:sporulation protein SsgA [Marmoricola sp.]